MMIEIITHQTLCLNLDTILFIDYGVLQQSLLHKCIQLVKLFELKQFEAVLIPIIYEGRYIFISDRSCTDAICCISTVIQNSCVKTVTCIIAK